MVRPEKKQTKKMPQKSILSKITSQFDKITGQATFFYRICYIPIVLDLQQA
jgi:hypothetical protein